MTKAMVNAAVTAANGDDLHTAVIRLPGIDGEKETNFIPQLVASVLRVEHKMQVGQHIKKLNLFALQRPRKPTSSPHVLSWTHRPL
jgi:hypothetical protein